MHRTFIILFVFGLLVCCDRAHQNLEPDVITDTATGLQWAKPLSNSQLTWDQARNFCFDLQLGGFDDWRLPTRVELETMINPELVDKNSSSTEQPFHGPFVTQKDGYIFSGSPVDGYGNAPWIMRLANGHIFNGKDYEAYARCVRDSRFK
jgi:hypothetical protein